MNDDTQNTIEKAAKALVNHMYGYDAWDEHVTREGVRDVYRCQARVVLESAGVALPSEPLPVGTRKRSPEGEVEAILTDDGGPCAWFAYGGGVGRNWLTDAQVADWEIIPDAPKATIDAESLIEYLRAAGWIQTAQDSRFRIAIRAWADAHGHHPAIPEGHVTVDMRGHGLQILKLWANLIPGVDANGPHGDPFADAARAELARRGESA